MDTIYADGTYLRNNPEWHAGDSPWKAGHVASLLERHALAPRTICEVGCGAGGVLEALADRVPAAAELHGYEISPQAHAIASRKSDPRLRFHLKDLLQDAGAFFDVVLALDVFEHVEDYFTFLRRLRAKGRHKVFHIPLELSALWVGRGAPLMKARRAVGHLHHFTRDTALAALEDTGYTVIEHRYTAAATDRPSKSWKSRLLNIPRRILFAIAPDATARVLGGYSLLVLAT